MLKKAANAHDCSDNSGDGIGGIQPRHTNSDSGYRKSGSEHKDNLDEDFSPFYMRGCDRVDMGGIRTFPAPSLGDWSDLMQ